MKTGCCRHHAVWIAAYPSATGPVLWDNLIPEWNDLLYRGDWKAAYERLQATNNFPEFTGRICPASCEHACVLNLNLEPVTIRENEVAIVERAFAEGYITLPMQLIIFFGLPFPLFCGVLVNQKDTIDYMLPGIF